MEESIPTSPPSGMCSDSAIHQAALERDSVPYSFRQELGNGGPCGLGPFLQLK
jgi:hypothetical protein